MKHPKLVSLIAIVAIFSIVGALSWAVINAQSVNAQAKDSSPVPVQVIAQNPVKYINQTVTVTGLLSSLPLPHPLPYQLSDDNQTVAVYVEWNSSTFLIPQVNATTATVHGVLREEQWNPPNVMPPNSVKMDIYYIVADKVELPIT